MKHNRTTDTLPATLGKGHSVQVAKAAGEAQARLNGGLPPLLHLANRMVLLGWLKKLHEENKRLRATKGGAA